MRRVLGIGALFVLLALTCQAMDPVPPVAVGVVGIDAKTGEVLWEAWEKQAVPSEYQNLTDDALFREEQFGRTGNFRPAQLAFGLPAASGEFSISIGKAPQGNLPDEIGLIRKRAGKVIGEKKFNELYFRVNALGDHFYYVDSTGVLKVFKIDPGDADDLWIPEKEIPLPLPPSMGGAIRIHAHLRLLVRKDRLYVQIPDTLLCLNQDGSEVWQISTDGFDYGRYYVPPPQLHFTTDRIYLQDSSNVAAIDLGSGELIWKAPLNLGIYPSSCALFSDDGKVAIFSSEYYTSGPGFPFAKHFVSKPPAAGDGFGAHPSNPSAPPKLTQADGELFLSYIAELRAYGSRAMQVLLKENIDNPHAVPPILKDEVNALLAENWPEFRSRRREGEYFARGLIESTPPPFDRIRAWRMLLPEKDDVYIRSMSPLKAAGMEGVLVAIEKLSPDWPFPWAPLRREDAPFSVDLLRHARKTFENADGLEKQLAACVLAANPGLPHGSTLKDAEAWKSDPDPILQEIAIPVWSYFSTRQQILDAIEDEVSESNRGLLIRLLAVKKEGTPSDKEIAFWLKAADERSANLYAATFVSLFRESRDGKLPASFEQSLRAALRRKIPAFGDYEDGIMTIFLLEDFKNSADDELLMQTHQRLGDLYHLDYRLKLRGLKISPRAPGATPAQNSPVGNGPKE